MSDKEDIFARFRQPEAKPQTKARRRTKPKPEAAEGEPLPPIRPETYTAFTKGKRRERLLIDRAAQAMRLPAYHELRDISFDQSHQSGFLLFFQAMTVEVLGKHLWPVVHAIASGRCAGLYEFHPKLYSAPPAEGEPLIESIRLLPSQPLAED